MKKTVMFMCLIGVIGGVALAETEAGKKAEVVTAMKQIDQMISEAKIDTAKDGWKLNLPKPAQASFEEGATYYADIATSHGPVRLRLMPDVAPMHVTSFIYLSRLGFYDGLKFHRVIPDFMAQGGCPLGTGTAGPGYKYDGEYSRSVRHDKPGLLSMANAGPGTDGSQFFLTFKATPWLDGKHTIYGEVVDGMETLKAMEKVGSRSGRTTETITMEKVTISVE